MASKPGNSYSKLEKGVDDIAMPPVGFNLGDDNNPSTVPAKEEPKSFGGLAALPEEESTQYEAQEEDQDHEKSSNQVESDDSEDVEEVEEKAQPVKKTKEDNLRLMRERSERAERERDMMMNRMIEMEARQKQYQPIKQQEPVEEVEEDFDFNINEDDLVDGKTVKKVANRIKQLEERLKKQSYESREVAIETKIKSDFPDFDKVVSVDNVQKLNEEYPEVATMLRDTPDLYNKAASAYRIMKKFGIHKELYGSDKAKAIANSQKPRPLASVSPQQGDSPLSKANAFANGMTKELQQQLRKEMDAARKSI